LKGTAKNIILVAVGLLVVFALLVSVIPQIQTSVLGFTTVTDELVGVGDGAETDFTFVLDRQPVESLSLVITEAVEDFTDTLGTGVLTAEGAGDGTLVYATGAVDLNYAVAPAVGNITATYNVEDVPGILTTLAGLWWIPLIIVLVGLVMATKGGRNLIKRTFRRSRRGRKRRKP